MASPSYSTQLEAARRGVVTPEMDFVARREQPFWTGLRSRVEAWDKLIADFNARTGAG